MNYVNIPYTPLSPSLIPGRGKHHHFVQTRPTYYIQSVPGALSLGESGGSLKWAPHLYLVHRAGWCFCKGLELYSGGNRFESLSSYRLSWMRFMWFFSVYAEEYRRNIHLEIGHYILQICTRLSLMIIFP